MERKEILDNMRKLKAELEKDLADKYLQKLKEGVRERGYFDENKVLDIKYLGKAGQDSKIFLALEQLKDKNGDIIMVEKYFRKEIGESDFELIAGNNKSDKFGIFLTNAFKEQEYLLEQLEQMDKEGILDLNEMEKDRIEEIARALNVDAEEIFTIDEINANQEIKFQNKDNRHSRDEKSGLETISKENFSKLDMREETNINKYIKGSSLANKLGLEQKGIKNVDKIVRVSTSSLNGLVEERNSNPDSFVAITFDKQGNEKAVFLGEDILQEDRRAGTNPEMENTTMNIDGYVNKESINSSYKIVNGNGEEYLQIGYDEASGKEIKYATRSRETGEILATELSTQRTLPENSYVRQYLNTKGAGIDETQEILEKDKQHAEECKEKDVTVIDTDEQNDTHSHFDREDEYFQENVKEILDDIERKVGEEIFTKEEIEGMLENFLDKKRDENLTIEELMEDAKENIVEDAQNMRQLNR